MKKRLFILLFSVLLSITSTNYLFIANSLVKVNPKDKLESLLNSELRRDNGSLFYKITTFWNETGYEYYGNKDYRVIFDKKNKYFTFMNNEKTLTELTDRYKKSRALVELKKKYASFVEEDKDELIYFSNFDNTADNTISFISVLRDILKRGENLKIKDNLITGNFSNDKLLPGFDRLIFSDGVNVFNFKVSYKNDVIESYEFYMFSGEGEYRKKRLVVVERSKLAKKYNWPTQRQIVKRSELENKIVELSIPENKLKFLNNYTDIEDLKVDLNNDKSLFSSYVVKLKDGYGMYTDIRDRNNYLEAICFDSLENIKNFRECRVEDQPIYNDSLKGYLGIIEKMILDEYPVPEFFRALDMLSHSLFLYDRSAIATTDDNDHYSWYYMNNIVRYIDSKNK